MVERTSFTTIPQRDLRLVKNFEFLKGLAKLMAAQCPQLVFNEIFYFVEGGLKAICNTKCVIFEASPFYKSKLEDSDCDKYCKLLKEELSNSIPNVDLIIRDLDHLPYCSSSLQVIVVDKKKIHYEGIFMSVSMLEQENEEKTVSLPLLCVLRGMALSPKVHELFQLVFNCNIKQCEMSDVKFNWVWGIALLETMRKNECDGLHLVYHLPSFKNSVTINYTILEDDLKAIWFSFRDPDDEVLPLSDIQKLYKGIEEHISITLGIDLTCANLVKVMMQGVSVFVSKHLQLNVDLPEVMYSILSYIQSDCIGNKMSSVRHLVPRTV